VVKQMVDEDPGSAPGWTQVQVNYEGIDSSWSKPVALNVNGDKITCNKATSLIDASPDDILSVYWGRDELEWNLQTVQKILILEDLQSVQIVHQELKKHTLANMQNDIVFRRAYDRERNGTIWIYAVSEPGPAPKAGFTRGTVVFGGILLKSVGSNKTQATIVWCFDYNKKLQVKYLDEEPKRTPLRLCRIKKKVDANARVTARSAEYESEKNRAQKPQTESIHKPGAARGGGVFGGTTTTGSVTGTDDITGVVQGCPSCRTQVPGTFCPTCGDRTTLLCASCKLVATGNSCLSCEVNQLCG